MYTTLTSRELELRIYNCEKEIKRFYSEVIKQAERVSIESRKSFWYKLGLSRGKSIRQAREEILQNTKLQSLLKDIELMEFQCHYWTQFLKGSKTNRVFIDNEDLASLDKKLRMPGS